MKTAKTRTLALSLGLVALVLDQASKWWIVEVVMQPPRYIEVTSFFNLVMGWNKGVSFGLFSRDSDMLPWILVALALVIVVGLWWAFRDTGSKLVSAAVGLVIGGALGNVVDRIRYRAVADFLDFHWAGWHWPAFNVADTAITIGAVMLVLDSLRARSEKEGESGTKQADVES